MTTRPSMALPTAVIISNAPLAIVIAIAIGVSFRSTFHCEVLAVLVNRTKITVAVIQMPAKTVLNRVMLTGLRYRASLSKYTLLIIMFCLQNSEIVSNCPLKIHSLNHCENLSLVKRILRQLIQYTTNQMSCQVPGNMGVPYSPAN
jgi:hypothetical protein